MVSSLLCMVIRRLLATLTFGNRVAEQVRLENLVLCHQVMVLRRQVKRPVYLRRDRWATCDQAEKWSSAYLRSSSAWPGLRLRLSPRSCESAWLERPRKSRSTTLSKIVPATSLPMMAGV